MATLEPGTLVTPTIRLVRPLRRGGMGSVWIAEHLALRTQVVVKFISEALTEDPSNLARFQREAAAAAQVKSPHVVQILDYGVTPERMPYIVMELLEGRDLAATLRGCVLQPAEVAHIVEHIARALTRAHERGIVHRDIKPANIFLCDVGANEPFVKLVDFGIAKSSADLASVTTSGEVIGTPAYMSPEQLNGSRDVDAKTDLWSLGVVAFRALTGVGPFDKDSIGAVALAVTAAPIPRPSQIRPGLSPAIDAWFFRACSREHEGRFSSAREMADALWVAVGRAPAATPSGPGAQSYGTPSSVASGASVASSPAQPSTSPSWQLGAPPLAQPSTSPSWQLGAPPLAQPSTSPSWPAGALPRDTPAVAAEPTGATRPTAVTQQVPVPKADARGSAVRLAIAGLTLGIVVAGATLGRGALFGARAQEARSAGAAGGVSAVARAVEAAAARARGQAPGEAAPWTTQTSAPLPLASAAPRAGGAARTSPGRPAGATTKAPPSGKGRADDLGF